MDYKRFVEYLGLNRNPSIGTIAPKKLNPKRFSYKSITTMKGCGRFVRGFTCSFIKGMPFLKKAGKLNI
jgi:hypothetical protein